MSYSEANNSRSPHQAPHLLLNNQAIPKLQHIRYLGVTFSKNCTFNQDVKETLKNLLATEPTSYTGFEGASVGGLYHIYKSFIRPVIEYRAHLHHLSTPRQVPLQQPPPGNQHNPDPIPPQRTPESNSFKYPSRDGCLLNRIPKSPKRKLKHPPTALLLPVYTDLPDDLQKLLDSTPLTMRYLNNRTQKLQRTTQQQDHPSTGPPRTLKTPSSPPSPICPT
ncbi:hypothetical protein GEV33_007526 [Tenebrio molitor]|uniref:Uncharacterized protein n=1 Tax=Tenebrio molitor TaxID=7067 RepID=A0A8J6HI64_TENMO|nr:hypothetical protein GEV33_007526 [Tenebrio molitor]